MAVLKPAYRTLSQRQQRGFQQKDWSASAQVRSTRRHSYARTNSIVWQNTRLVMDGGGLKYSLLD